MFVKPRTSPFTGGHSSHALRFGPLGGARRTQMRSSALGMLPQFPRGLMLDCARHTSHCESNFGSFCRGCPTQRSRVPSSVSWVDSSRLRSCSVAASRLGFYLVSPPSSRLGSGPRLVASSRVGLAGGSWWLAVTGWCLTVSLGGSGKLAAVLRFACSWSSCLAACPVYCTPVFSRGHFCFHAPIAFSTSRRVDLKTKLKRIFSRSSVLLA